MKLHQVLTPVALACLAGISQGQSVLVQEDFEIGEGNGWLANGVATIFETGDGNPGNYIGVPYLDFWGVELRHEDPAAIALGDLTQYGSVTIGVDVRVFQLRNFFGDDMNPAWFDLTLQLTDRGDPDDFMDDVSVYYTIKELPQVEDGWARFTWTIPNTAAQLLPAGWGGTGAEDPVDYHPILPPDRTFSSVLAHVTEIKMTTMTPGFFYGSSFWEMGFDNVEVSSGPALPCSLADLDASGAIDLTDFFAFLNCFDQSEPCADVDGTPGVELGDFFEFFNAFDVGC